MRPKKHVVVCAGNIKESQDYPEIIRLAE